MSDAQGSTDAHVASDTLTHGAKSKKPCTVCSDFSSFAKKQSKKASTPSQANSANASTSNETSSSTANQSSTGVVDEGVSLKDEKVQCPPDRVKLGKHSWTLLHTMAAYYPEKPNDEDKTTMTQFIGGLARHYPCQDCASHLRKHISKHPPTVDSNQEVSRWMCDTHNEVNKYLGKDIFDCSKTFERWRDGWKDGSCD